MTIDERRRSFDADPLHKLLGITLGECRPGFGQVFLDTTDLTLRGIGGSLHGGLSALLADTAMLQAIIPMIGAGEMPGGTAELNISYLRPVLGPRVTTEATVIKKGRQIAVVEVSILDGQGRLAARSRMNYAIRQAARAGE